MNTDSDKAPEILLFRLQHVINDELAYVAWALDMLSAEDSQENLLIGEIKRLANVADSISTDTEGREFVDNLINLARRISERPGLFGCPFRGEARVAVRGTLASRRLKL